MVLTRLAVDFKCLTINDKKHLVSLKYFSNLAIPKQVEDKRLIGCQCFNQPSEWLKLTKSECEDVPLCYQTQAKSTTPI